MSLMMGLILRLFGVACVCLAGAIVYVVADTQAAIRTELKATETRVAFQLERIYMLGSGGVESTHIARRSIEIVSVMTPGTCVAFTERDGGTRRLCSGWNAFGSVAPGWFRAALAAGFRHPAAVEREVRIFGEDGRRLRTSFDPVAAATRIWQQVRIAAALAVALAAAMIALSSLAIAHALLPVQAIVDGLKRLEMGDIGSRLPSFRTAEFRRLAIAVNRLASRLERSTAERAVLMRKLFEVQEDERRTLARELHDEFSQCLTAAGAMAASLEAASPQGRDDIAEDARAIGRMVKRMMATLRGAFVRLRPPDLDQLGLEPSLRTMLHGWEASLGGRTRFVLETEGDLAGLDDAAALNLYRIVQECLTNAARHGSARRIVVRVVRDSAGGAPGVELTVMDDGGGRPEALERGTGFGIAGIRERIAALGGTLSIGEAKGGIRVAATIPTGALRP